MNQTRKTTFDELYTVFCELVTVVTGRPCWRKMGLQSQPNGPYATIYFEQGPSPSQDVVEMIDDLESPRGLIQLECKAEFFRNVRVASALDAARRFCNGLQLESRFRDVWQIAGMAGEIRTLDVSAMFRADIEGRAEVRWGMYANIGAPLLNQPDNTIGEIEHQGITIYRDTNDPPPVASVTIDKPI